MLLNFLFSFFIHLNLELQISPSNDEKILLFIENRHFSNWKKWIAERLSQAIFINFSGTVSEPFHREHRLYTSASDVCRRQMLTYKDDPRTEKIKIFITAADP